MKKLMKWKAVLLMMAFLMTGFLVAPVHTYADVTESYSSTVGDNVGADATSQKHNGVGNRQDTKNPAESNHQSMKMFWLIALFVLVLLALVALIIFLFYQGNHKKESLPQLCQAFDQTYDAYRRKYAYCVEELNKADRLGTSKAYNNIFSMRENMKEIYISMLEAKHQRDMIPNCFVSKKEDKVNIAAMKELCQNSTRYQRRMDRYLSDLRELILKTKVKLASSETN